jgi:hypothetical protein
MLGLEGGVTSVLVSPEPSMPASEPLPELPPSGGLQTPMLLQV